MGKKKRKLKSKEFQDLGKLLWESGQPKIEFKPKKVTYRIPLKRGK